MALFSVALPVLPGKEEQLQRFMGDLNGARRADFAASRKRLGVHERTFVQSTPMGNLVIVTLEGDNPAAAMAQFGASDDAFTRWFVDQVKEIHGLDLTQPPPFPLPELKVDSQR
jgi:hypothetical protein